MSFAQLTLHMTLHSQMLRLPTIPFKQLTHSNPHNYALQGYVPNFLKLQYDSSSPSAATCPPPSSLNNATCTTTLRLHQQDSHHPQASPPAHISIYKRHELFIDRPPQPLAPTYGYGFQTYSDPPISTERQGRLMLLYQS